ATIVPFAQKDMVDRFVFGLDDSVRRSIEGFCEKTIVQIRESALKEVESLPQNLLDNLNLKLLDAEKIFINSLKTKAFNAIRGKSRKDIEDMVEFMPKPEMARLAESLIELT